MLDLCDILDGDLDLQLHDLDEEIFESNLANTPTIKDSQDFIQNDNIKTKLAINIKRGNYFQKSDDFSVYLTQGGKPTMQDTFSYAEFENGDFIERMFCIFDGHQSQIVSNYLSQNLANNIFNHPLYKINAQLAIQQTFDQINKQIIDALKDQEDSGSTALILIIRKYDYLVINLGDSLAQMIMEKKRNTGIIKKKIKKLNKLHRTSCQKECERIERQGGWIIKVKKTLRVQGQLQVTRSFGDTKYQPYIQANPDIYFTQKNQNQKFIIMASDGFWDEDILINNIDDLFNNPQRVSSIIERNQGYIKDNLSLFILKIF